MTQSSKTNELQEAIEKIAGHSFDTITVLAYNSKDGSSLKAAKGEKAALALLIAEEFKRVPGLENMVKNAQKLMNGQLPDDLVKKLFEALGGDDND